MLSESNDIVLIRGSMFFLKLLPNNISFIIQYYFPSNAKFYEQKFLLYICSLSLSSSYRFVDTLLYPVRVLRFCKCDRIVTEDFSFW